MTVNIYDSANQIEKEIRELPEFLALKEAFEGVKADEATFKLFKEFQTLQMELQQKQMQGQEFSEDDAKLAQELAEKVQESDLINELMTKEQAFSMIINDLNRVIMKPIQELYAEV
ncbi:YlbF family regulator [Vagococcus sp. PNs007]|uniref:UPF0342 protein OL233_03160 n=1 Tax=Vagococcus proximus TaxID=2991417 RepID=A0ABT5WZV0_9ENTE|nr:YlbF family regulator [Vagococcus proximus]MDF0479278.1 YlbF family regulator [Vagococcus proximus]